MKLHRFYIPEDKAIEKGELAVGILFAIHFPELSHQMKNVLRLRLGEKIIFFNGNGNEYLGTIVSFDGRTEIKLHIETITKNDVSFKKELFLFFSLIKRDNIDLILQKGTEVGVSHFIPIVSSRSEKKDINKDRSEKILIEATEQCGRNMPPKIHEVMKLEDVFNRFDLSFIVLEKGSVSFTEKNIKDTRIGLFIGPEGGWTEGEMELFRNKKTSFLSLGPTVLRAETAAVVGSSKILNE